MNPDLPLRQLCESITRLDGSTRRHVAELDAHIRKTNVAVFLIAIALLIVTAINVFFIYNLYGGMHHIVGHMDGMYTNLQQIERNMQSISDRVSGMRHSMQGVAVIRSETRRMRAQLGTLRANMELIKDDVAQMSRDMHRVNQVMGGVSGRTQHMADGVAIMRESTRQLSGPMGVLNSIMP